MNRNARFTMFEPKFSWSNAMNRAKTITIYLISSPANLLPVDLLIADASIFPPTKANPMMIAANRMFGNYAIIAATMSFNIVKFSAFNASTKKNTPIRAATVLPIILARSTFMSPDLLR